MVADQTIRDADANAQGSTTMADLMAGLPPLLLGTYTPKIDAKGRMALPAKFRSQLGQGLVMARGQERCVYLLPFDEFRRIASQIQRVSVGNKAAREYLRVFLSGAVDQQPDKHTHHQSPSDRRRKTADRIRLQKTPPHPIRTRPPRPVRRERQAHRCGGRLTL